MPTNAEHILVENQLVAFSVGLLNADEIARIEQHLRDCPSCQDAVEAIRHSPPMEAAAGGHIPQHALETWLQTADQLHGEQRALVRVHLEECSQCRVLVAAFGGPTVLPVVDELETVGELKRVHGASASVIAPSAARNPWFSLRPLRLYAIAATLGLAALVVVQLPRDQVLVQLGPIASVEPASTRSSEHTAVVNGPAQSLDVGVHLPPDLQLDSVLTLRLIDPSGEVLREITGTWESLKGRRLLVTSDEPLAAGQYRVDYQSSDLPSPQIEYFYLRE